jgi:hypothetical protein
VNVDVVRFRIGIEPNDLDRLPPLDSCPADAGHAVLEITDCAFEKNAGAGLRAAVRPCIGGYDANLNFNSRIEGEGNVVPDPEEEGGSAEVALCPEPPSVWPAGFPRED